MRKNHHGKKDRLVKRIFALCLALAVICTCLVPVFATEGLIDPQVHQEASRPVDDGEASYPDDEFAGFGGDEAAGFGEPREVYDEGEAAGFGEDEVATRPVEGGEDNLDGGPTVTDSEWGTVIEYGPSSSTGTDPEPETQWSGEDDVVEKPDDKVIVSGDEIKKLQDMVVYRFWLKELNANDLQDITAQAQINNMTESEYLARNGEVLWNLYFIQAVPRAETIADYSSYIENPSSNRDPKGELRLFDYWYTLDEFGNRVRLNLTDPTSNILDDKTTTVNVYAAWKDGTVGSDEEEDVDHEDLVDKNPVPVDLTAKAPASYKDEDGNTKSVNLPVEVKNLLSAAHSLSVIHMGDDDMESFYESHEDSFGEMMPILGLKISPKNAKGETVQPANGQKATVTVSGLNELPDIAEMEEAGALNADALKVLHLKDDRTVETLDVVSYEDGTLTFETSSFSPFVVALKGGYDTELLDERASDGYVPLYLYALKPGLEWQGNSTKNNNNWYGIGIAKIKPRCYQGETTDSTYIKDKISNNDILLDPFTGKYSYILGTKWDYGTGKALYPKIGMDKMSVVDADKPGYTYWDGNGNMPTSYYYRVEWFHLTKEWGAPASDNGYNTPDVSIAYSTYHLDARITFSDMCNVDFMVKEPNQTEFKQLDMTKYSSAHIKGRPESDIVKPQENGYKTDTFNGYVFSGWYTDEACTQKAEFNGTIDSDKIYYGKYIPGGDQLQPDTAYLKVEKKVTGITRKDMNPQFTVTMSGNGVTHNLTVGGATTIRQSDGSFVLRWTVPNMKPGNYTIKESGTEVANYTCNASGMVGESVDVKANAITVQTGDVTNSGANSVFDIGEAYGQNRIFVVSSTGNFNVVVSLKPLSLSERTSVINALKQLTGDGTLFKKQADNTTFYSINADNSERIQIDSTILSYDSGAKTVTVVEPNGWNKALMLSYDVQEANNPEVEITNNYTLATADIEVSKLVTGMMGSLEKAFTFQIVGLPDTSKVVQNDVEKAANVFFTMKSGDSVTLKNVPVDTVFAVKEMGTDAKDYQTTATGYTHVTDIQSGDSERVFYYVVRYENGERVLKPCNASGESERDALNELKIQVTNHCGLLPDTGVLLDTLPYIVILAVVAGGVALLMLRKHRKEDD